MKYFIPFFVFLFVSVNVYSQELKFEHTQSKIDSQDYNIKQLSNSLEITQKYLASSSQKDFASLGIGFGGTLVGSIISIIPLFANVRNPKMFAGLGIGITTVSAIASLSIKISAIKDKKRAANNIKF